MSEVDYSQFYYRRERNDGVPPEPEPEKKTPPDPKPKKKRSGKPLLVILTLAVIFGIVFFGADFFTNGKIINSITASLRGNSYEYYFVVTETGGRDLAYAKSLLIKQSGGSGYIINEENKYLVVLSVFCNRTEAENVSLKNDNTYVHVAGFTSKSAEVFNALDEAVREICANIKSLENGSLPESEVYGALLEIRAKLLQIKTKIIDGGEQSEINLLDYAIGSIDGLEIGKGTRLEFLSDVRYVLSGIIISMKLAN